jgi:hypothetical protein
MNQMNFKVRTDWLSPHTKKDPYRIYIISMSKRHMNIVWVFFWNHNIDNKNILITVILSLMNLKSMTNEEF